VQLAAERRAYIGRRERERGSIAVGAGPLQLEAEDTLAQSGTDVATTPAAVFKALGGAWV
jgi:hypothetical protein